MQDEGIGRKWEVTRMISQLFIIIFTPLEVCSQAHKCKMCTLYDPVCTDSSYETLQDRGIGKKMKSFQNDLKTLSNCCTSRSEHISSECAHYKI